MKLVFLWMLCTVAGFVMGAAVVADEPLLGAFAITTSIISAGIFFWGAAHD